MTWRVKVGSLCLKKKSQMSSVPSIFVVKNTPGLVGLQHPSVSVCVCVCVEEDEKEKFICIQYY